MPPVSSNPHDVRSAISPAAELATRRARLSEANRAMLRKRLRGTTHGAEGASVAALPARKNIPRLSSAQRRMWFFHELQPDSPVYNIPFAVRLKGRLNPLALHEALERIVARHEILRTRIESVNGAPVPVVEEGASPVVTEIDLRPDREPERALRELLADEARRPFDLTHDLMLRVTLVRLRDDEHALMIVMHHIASDLWSWDIFLRELETLYAAAATGPHAELPALPLQYADYAAAEHESLAGLAMKRSLGYWKQQLAGAPAVLELPGDRPRPSALNFRGALARRALSPAAVTALEQLGRQEDATLFVTLLAAFKVLLFRLSSQPDIVVGVPTAGRTLPHTEALIGLFVNTLALRDDLAGDPTFIELLRQVKATALEAMSHQELPFDKLIEELRPARPPGCLPLVQVMFTLQPAATNRVQLSGLLASPIDVDPRTARFDLTLVAEQTADGLNLVLEYSTDLFDAATADRMLGQFETLLTGVVADPQHRISTLPLLTAAERHQLVVGWNRTHADFPIVAGLHQLFERQAVENPRREALVVGTQRLTYRELNERAEHLARRLRDLGVGPDLRVALFLPRNAEMVIAMLAILKAGGAYVAMDPAYPRERLAFILQDSRAEIVITQRSLRSALPVSAARVFVADVEAEASRDARPTTALRAAVREHDLAYVIYTSGSTGRPKGVAIEHRNAIAFVRWAGTVFNARQLDGVLAGTSICFDLSVFEIFGPLSLGGKVILADNPLALPSLPAAREVRLVNTVPSVMREVLRLGLPPSVETVNLAGEFLPAELVEQLYALPQIKHVYDLYGPSETTTYSTFTRRERGARATIGRPIANTELFIVDRHLEPVPIGVTGELLIGGRGVARGYLGRPILTAERFIANPFSANPADRLYRTGDLCRYRADGNVEYLGRADDQFKIRGFRVEAGEIESTLRTHPGLSDAAVVAPERVPGDRQLVAYVVPTAAARNGDAADLRAFLQRTLPEPMIPSAFVRIEKIPRTANGKVNRAALLELGGGTHVPTHDRVAPRDPLERQLVEIWESVLGTKPVGVTDRFFDLGGHSLLAVRLVSVIEKTLSCRLPVAALFQAPSVAELAELLRTRDQPAAASAVLAVQPKGTRAPLFLAHGMGGGNLWGYANIARELGEDQPVYAFKPGEPGDLPAHLTIEGMAAHYLQEMRRIQPKGPYRLGGYCFGGNLAYEMACQLEAAGETVGLLALMNAWPANAGHDRITWTPGMAGKFLANVFYWSARWWQWPVKTRRSFFRWKAQTLLTKWRRSRGSDATPAEPDIEQLVDLSATSASERQLWQAHLGALHRYHPRPYGGKITLLRTKGYPFFSSFDEAHGWRAFARGGVTVRFVPGMHETLMTPPYVHALAQELKSQLEADASRPRSVSGRTTPPVRPSAALTNLSESAAS